MISIKFLPKDLSFNHRGIFTILAALSMVALLGFSALVVDMGYIIYSQKRLDAATAAAALAGGQDLWSQPWATVQSSVYQYSGYTGTVAGYKVNGATQSSFPAVTPAATYYNTLSITGTLLSIEGGQIPTQPGVLPFSQAKSTYNAIRVTQKATVPLFFAPILGIPNATITSTATASAGGGAAQPLNVEIVLDTTQSMNANDPNCGNISKLQCAINGAQSLIAQLTAAGDNVGIVVFPPQSAQYTGTGCPPSSPTTVDYMLGTPAGVDTSGTSYSTLMTMQGASSYLTNGQVNKTSPLAKALGISGSGCTGLAAPGGKGTYYAQAVSQAQANLCKMSGATATNGCTGTGNGEQNVMVILSDGDAGSSNINGSANDNNQCYQAIQAANAAKTAKTWVYVIGYQPPTSSACTTDKYNNSSNTTGTNIQPCGALQRMAGTTSTALPTVNGPGTSPAVSSYFYSDSAGCSSPNAIGSVSSMFTSIGTALTGSRLLPNTAF